MCEDKNVGAGSQIEYDCGRVPCGIGRVLKLGDVGYAGTNICV